MEVLDKFKNFDGRSLTKLETLQRGP